MKILLTGSSGRIGRAIYAALASDHNVIGIDRAAFAMTRIVGDFADRALLEPALEGADAVVHTAALHSPHVGVFSDHEFERINVEGTHLLAELARASGVRRFVFTSTTALNGRAVEEGKCTWIDERTQPRPKSIYHRTKVAAEAALEALASDDMPVRVIRMSRCFPEPADLMAAYRLHRGVDVRDVSDAHVLALANDGPAFQRFIVSGATPFTEADCDALASAAPEVLRQRAPSLVQAFETRGWRLPQTIDRVYVPHAAERELGWRSRYGYDEVLAQLDRRSLEVLPVAARTIDRPE